MSRTRLDPQNLPAAVLRCMSAEDRALYEGDGSPVPRLGVVNTGPLKLIAPAFVETPPAVAIGPQGWRARFAVRPAPDASLFPSENSLQVALLKWISARATTEPARWLEAVMIFAVPNGGKRERREAAYMKAQGTRAGVPDLLLLVPRHGFHGLALELKNGPRRKPTDKQAAWLDWLESQGFFAACARTLGEAQAVLAAYL